MPIWFITGASSGLGRAVALEALARQHQVVAGYRTAAEVDAFVALSPGHAFGVVLDVSDEAATTTTVLDVETRFGRIDTLVNAAGYGLEGIIEETSLEDFHRQFDVNLFGSLALMKAVLPGMRQRRSGCIINITSMAGFAPSPGLGAYSASKAALTMISEALAKEVSAFGIKVIAVAPGAFRTDWAGRSMVRSPRSIPDYDSLMDPIREKRRNFSGNQPGDPQKAAALIVALPASESLPANILLGSDAWENVTSRLQTLQDEFASARRQAQQTDF